MKYARYSDAIIFWLINLVPYLFVSWAVMALVDGDSTDFLGTLAVLIAVRLFFGLIETITRFLRWRLHGKRFMVNFFLKTLQDNNLPKRAYSHEDFSIYLDRIQYGDYSDSVKHSNMDMILMLAAASGTGFLELARMFSATNAAFDLYSPRAEEPEFCVDSQ